MAQMVDENDPWKDFKRVKPEASVQTDDPWKDFKRVNPGQGGDLNAGYQSREIATLPEPHQNMFASMDDEDAATYYEAYKKHPNSTVDAEGNVIYNGVAVPPPEGNSNWLVKAAQMGGRQAAGILNPVGAVADLVNGSSGVTEVGAAVGGGAVNTGKNILEATAAGSAGGLTELPIVSQVDDAASAFIPGYQEGKNALVEGVEKYVPEYNPEGMIQHGAETGGEIATGLMLGSKANEITKIAGLTPKIASAFSKFLPQWTSKLAAAVTTRMPLQAAGQAAVTSSDSNTLVLGDKALLPIFQGIDTNDPDKAREIIKQRINVAADAFLTALPIEGGGKMIATVFKKMVGERILDPLKLLVSADAQEEAVANEIMAKLAHMTGKESDEEITKIHSEIVDLMKDKSKQTVKSSGLGLPTMADKEIKLDPTTIASREFSGSANPEDLAKVEALKQYRNKTVQEGGGKTEYAGTSVERGIKDITEQSSEAFAGSGRRNIKEGLTKTQDLARAEQTGIDIEKGLAKSDEVSTLNQINDKVFAAEKTRTAELTKRFEAIPDDAGYDPKSFGEAVDESIDSLSPKLKKLIEKSDGTWKYLNNKLKPAINNEISRMMKNPQMGDDIQALRGLRKNIEEDQLDYLASNRSVSGRMKKRSTDVIDTAAEAKRYGKEEVFPNRQGPFDDLRRIAKEERLNPDELQSRSRKIIKQIVDNPDEPEHSARLEKILSSKEGGESEKLIEQYVKSKDKGEFLVAQEKNLYKEKFKAFFKGKGFPTENGEESFKKLLSDPESTRTIKEMMDTNDPVLHDAMKATWMEHFEKSAINKVNTLPSGSPKAVLSSEDRRQMFEYGKEIFRDQPKVVPFLKDLFETAQEVAQSRGMKAAEGGIASTAETQARTAGSNVITIQAGRLTHKAAIENALFGIMVRIPNVNAALKAIKDKAMADPEELARILSKWDSPEKRKPGSMGRDLSRWVLESVVHDDADTNRFEKKVSKDPKNTEAQTKELLSKKKTLVDDAMDFGSSVASKGKSIADQTGKMLGLE